MNYVKCLTSVFAVFLTSVVIGCRDATSAKLPPSNVKPDEDILFFPTYGRFVPGDDVWEFDVHGKVFEPENSSAKRAAFISAVRRSFNLGSDAVESAFLDARVRPFLVDNERGKLVTIEVANERFQIGPSGGNGHFLKSLVLKPGQSVSGSESSQLLEYQAILYDRDPRSFAGRVHLIAPQGVSVVSDIDDTIKLSQVTDKSELLKNTFVREFRAVAGMPELYAGLADSGIAFHYVSGSPWQLYEPLQRFLSDSGFPLGTFHLKHFRLKDSSALDLFGSQKETKIAAITPLLNAFPKRSFVLIGDSGEQDPEIYGAIAREYPLQIAGIFIRNVTNEPSDGDRYVAAFENVPRELWMLFDEAPQITDPILEVVSRAN